MEHSAPQSTAQGTENPWPLFPEQPIKEPTAAELEAVSVKDKAGFWRRTAAFFIDFILLQWITMLFLWLGAVAEDLAMAQSLNFPGGLSESLMDWAELHTRIWSLLFLVYFSFFTWYGGQTPGKMALGIRVVTTNGQPISWLRALGRTLCYNLDVLSFGFGFLLAAVPPAKRALHDMIAGTVVVKVETK
ncbi:MAG TPA: RDD family protein [Nitrospiria bacterium]|nr:RDD family protein [Nitrospiria bacterium]